MKNQRGGAPAVVLVFKILFVGAFATAMYSRPAHIIKRANEKCVADGGTAEVCKSQVDGWTQAERIEYIRDKATGPTTYNFTHS